MQWFKSIVAGFKDAGALRRKQLWRQGLAIAVIVAAASYPFLRAFQEPSLGLRFELAADNSIVAKVIGSAGAGDLQGASGTDLALYKVTHVSNGAVTVALSPLLLLESAGVAHSYVDHHVFYETHAQLWQIVHSPTVAIAHQGGVVLVRTEAKTVGMLGPRFWFPWAVAVVSLSIGLGVWLYTPVRLLGRLYGLASIGFTWVLLVLACSSSRLLTQEPELWHLSHKVAHLAGYLQNCSLALILWFYPTRLGGWRFGWGLLVWSLVWICINWWEWVSTISIGFRLPIALFGPLFWTLLLLQWRAAKGDAVKLAQLKWLSFLFIGAFAVIFVAYVYASNDVIPLNVPQAYGFAFMSLLYIGLVPLMSKLQVFELERWWLRAWLWFLGGLMVVAFDLALVGVFSLHAQNALMLSMAMAGWLYFPLRQWLWDKLARTGLPQTSDVLPDIVALSSTASDDVDALNERWQALWEKVFEPNRMRAIGGQWAIGITDDGRTLHVPGEGALSALELHLPKRGARLFSAVDAARATEIVTLVRHGLNVQAAHQRGVQDERRRIASDLHDDLGARLLQIAQSSTSGHVAQLARLALEDMRLSVRGLTSGPALLQDLLADWRSEVVSRAQAADLAVQWSSPDDTPALRVPAQTAAQITRVLREATTNIIKHAQATQLRASIEVSAGEFCLEIADNGKGLLAARAAGVDVGHGLLGMERRVRNLGGHMRVYEPVRGGTTVLVSLPVGSWTQATATAGGVLSHAGVATAVADNRRP